ncbi:MAG: 16S rRNA (guanine(527)-N(7))-methyltransferase RsmG [Thermoleophilales bacterium]|nr:16S rRNA (guanine(527)-N(7))-methyltransferase RsmG [Thermoleophilales bacterium]
MTPGPPATDPGGQGHSAGESPPPWRDPEQIARLDPLLEMLATSHVSLSSVTDPVEARRVHVADSLSGLACAEVREATRAVDLGSGAGFPGLPLALELPECRFTLIDSVGRKVEFMGRAISALGLENAEALKVRSEAMATAGGRESFDLVTARAVAPLPALAELASPLLEDGGHLVAWKGEPEPDSEEIIAANRDRLAMELRQRVAVVPFEGSRERHLYVLVKAGPTPDGLPRRPGMARKRPLGGDGSSARSSSANK